MKVKLNTQHSELFSNYLRNFLRDPSIQSFRDSKKAKYVMLRDFKNWLKDKKNISVSTVTLGKLFANNQKIIISSVVIGKDRIKVFRISRKK